MRTRFKRRGGPRKRAIWVNVPFGNVTFGETIGAQVLVTPEDWEAQFGGNANETAVLRAIVGELSYTQTAVGAVTNNGFWGLYIAGANESGSLPAFTVGGMAEVDWLRVGAMGVSSSVTTSLTSALEGVIPIHVKAKRKLRSRDQIYFCAQYGVDAGTPAGVFGGILRFLIARD